MIEIKTYHQHAETYNNAVRWCMTEFGVDSERWRYSKLLGPGYDYPPFRLIIYFHDESDAMAFKLGWL